MVLTLFALGGAQCALLAVIALKTQKNEKKKKLLIFMETSTKMLS